MDYNTELLAVCSIFYNFLFVVVLVVVVIVVVVTVLYSSVLYILNGEMYTKQRFLIDGATEDVYYVEVLPEGRFTDISSFLRYPRKTVLTQPNSKLWIFSILFGERNGKCCLTS